ncbi:MAG: hypothetical protein KAI17_20305, partial [Thiotrichaceae bacterium]|nr:hypothetical protein [Thiotrichaceae bacterium]
MRDDKKNIDDLIKQALTEEESEILDRLGEEQNVFEQLLSNFQGKMKWMSMYIAFMILVFFILSIYCLIEFINAEDIRLMILWGAGMSASFLTVGMLKMWQWMQMDKNSIMRELKRLELHLASIN